MYLATVHLITSFIFLDGRLAVWTRLSVPDDPLGISLCLPSNCAQVHISSLVKSMQGRVSIEKEES